MDDIRFWDCLKIFLLEGDFTFGKNTEFLDYDR